VERWGEKREESGRDAMGLFPETGPFSRGWGKIFVKEKRCFFFCAWVLFKKKWGRNPILQGRGGRGGGKRRARTRCGLTENGIVGGREEGKEVLTGSFEKC